MRTVSLARCLLCMQSFEYQSATPCHAFSSCMIFQHDQAIKLCQTIERQHRTKEKPSADFLEPPRPKQTSLRIRYVKSVDMALLQPLDYEVTRLVRRIVPATPALTLQTVIVRSE